MHTRRVVFADIESVGVDPNGPIRQIAAVAVDEALREIEAFDAKIRVHWREAHARRTRHSQISISAETETARGFAAFLSRHATLNIMTVRGATLRVAQLAAHHAVHDGPFLQAFFARNHRFYPGDYRMLCTVQRAQWFFQENTELTPPVDFKLATLCEYFGVPFPHAKRHNALHDVRATVELYRAILRHEVRLVFRNQPKHLVRPAAPQLGEIMVAERVDQSELAFSRCIKSRKR